MTRRRLSIPQASAAFVVACAAAVAPAAPLPGVDFNRDIRPIISDNCFACHGPDAKSLKGDFRIDQRDSVTKANKHGRTPIVPGKPDAGELVKRIFTTDADDLMPPPDSHKTLTEAQKQTLKRWIAEGAVYQAHWAYRAPVHPALPAVKNTQWVRNDIDRFVLAKLEAQGLTPSKEADRRTLIRRLSFDLIGLPPEVADVESFVADGSPDAYEKLVDRLLKNPHYGERMAMWWLDGARYADSNGFQDDSQRFMWPWRDWVINAFNADKPFDQFTVEQLAGDLLPNATPEQKIATGFNRNHRLNAEGGIIPDEWRVETVIDRVETTSQVWMAATMGCCRCHDHKYDPYTQKEFYQFFAIFNNVPETGTGARNGNTPPVMRVPTPEDQKKSEELDAALADATARVKALEPKLEQLQAAWEPRAKEYAYKHTSPWVTMDVSGVVSWGNAKLAEQPDGSYLASGDNPASEIYTVIGSDSAEPVTAVLLEVMPDNSLPNASLGRSPDGDFILSSIEAQLTCDDGSVVNGKFVRAAADYSQKGFEVENVLKGVFGKGWGIEGNRKENRLAHKAMFILDEPLKPAIAGVKGKLQVKLYQQAEFQHGIGRFRLSTTSLPADKVKLGTPDSPELIKALLIDATERTDRQKTLVTAYFRANHAGPLTEADRNLSAAATAKKVFDQALPTVMVMEELPKPRQTHLLIRGQYDKPGDIVAAGLPHCLPPLPDGMPMNRLGLARWLTDPSHPLTSRVTVNRFWEMLFGVGIVKSSENFGTQAEFPSHPELLDYLATEFIATGWDIKRLQKLIVTSATYRQESKASSELRERDPENRLLAHGPRFRINAELVRDNALTIAGLMVDKIGGPAVRPYQPEGVWDETSVFGNLRNYKHDDGEGLYRRSMYTIWKRTAAPPDMTMFDMPSHEICAVKRARTNTPLQALILLNNETYIEAARALAQKMILEGGPTPRQRIDFAFRRAVARPASDAELDLLTGGLAERLSSYRGNPDAAKQLIAVGESKADPRLDPAELAAYTMTASVILNLDETITKE